MKSKTGFGHKAKSLNMECVMMSDSWEQWSLVLVTEYRRRHEDRQWCIPAANDQIQLLMTTILLVALKNKLAQINTMCIPQEHNYHTFTCGWK